MPYVTESYYTDTFYGEAVTPITDFAKYEARAEDVINMVTRNRISDIDALPPSIAELVRKAVCAQIEWYVWNGVETSVIGLLEGGFTVGKVSVNGGGRSAGSAKKESFISPAAIAYLEQTGLLFNAVPVAVRWWW